MKLKADPMKRWTKLINLFNSLGEKKRTGLKLIKLEVGTSVVVQWIRICLPVQGDTGLIPCPGRFHMPWRNQAHAPQPLSPRAGNTKASRCSRAHKPQPLIHVLQCLEPAHREPGLCNKRSHCDDHSEKSGSPYLENACMQQRRHRTPKPIIKKKVGTKKDVTTDTTDIQRIVRIWATMGGFPGSSAGKESTCNAGDPGSIPGSAKCPGEGIGYPLQYSWASLVAQTVKNLTAIRENGVRSLGWEDPLETETATHSSTPAWRIPWAEEPGGLQSTESPRSRTTERLSQATIHQYNGQPRRNGQILRKVQLFKAEPGRNRKYKQTNHKY